MLATLRQFGPRLIGVDAGVEHFCENDPLVAIETGAAALVAHSCEQPRRVRGGGWMLTRDDARARLCSAAPCVTRAETSMNATFVCALPSRRWLAPATLSSSEVGVQLEPVVKGGRGSCWALALLRVVDQVAASSSSRQGLQGLGASWPNPCCCCLVTGRGIRPQRSTSRQRSSGRTRPGRRGAARGDRWPSGSGSAAYTSCGGGIRGLGRSVLTRPRIDRQLPESEQDLHPGCEW